MKEDLVKIIPNTNLDQYPIREAPIIFNPMINDFKRGGSLPKTGIALCHYSNQNPVSKDLLPEGLSFGSSFNVPFTTSSAPLTNPVLPYRPHSSTTFLVPMDQLSPYPFFYPLQSFMYQPYSKMSAIERYQEQLSGCSPDQFRINHFWQYTLPDSKTTTASSVPIPKIGASAPRKSDIQENCQSSPYRPNNPRLTNSHSYHLPLDSEKHPISIGSEQFKRNNNQDLNLIVTLKLQKEQPIEMNQQKDKVDINSISNIDGIMYRRKINSKRRWSTHSSQAARIAYKNEHVEAYRYRNAYKFMLRNGNYYLKIHKFQLLQELREQQFTEDRIRDVIIKVEALKAKNSPTESQKQSRLKLNSIFLSCPEGAFILKKSLIFILNRLQNGEGGQILEKNRNTYMEACEVYIRRAGKVLEDHRSNN